MSSHSFLTQSYKNSYIHSKVENNKTVIEVNLYNKKGELELIIHNLKSIHAARCLITRNYKNNS